ncbi:MAG TPA: hypothetical protein DF383_00510 [Deltaproteobacteria bacterium]|nr:hypothetical protein [Deltaproteobacteria bacterium]
MIRSSLNKVTNSHDSAVAKRLARFAPGEAEALNVWFRLHPLGVNLSLQILEWLEDLAKKQDESPSHLLEEIAQTEAKEEVTVKEWGRRIRDELQHRLNPAQKQHEARFREWVKSLDLSTKVKLVPPQNFEGRDFQLCVTFSHPEDLQVELQVLLKNLEHQAWKGLQEF